MDLTYTASNIHHWSLEKGFWDHMEGNPSIEGEKIALMHSELSEALEELRKGNDAGVEEELADTIIRILDYCGYKGFDIEKAIDLKRVKNEGRPYKHGKNF